MDRRDQNGNYQRNDRDRDQNGYSNENRDRSYSYGVPQGDRDDNLNMSAVERSGFRAGLSAGRSDRQSGRSFSPRATGATSYSGQDQQLFRRGYRMGYQRGFYGQNNNNSQYQR